MAGHGRVPEERARGLGYQISLGVDHEVSLQGAARGSGRAGARSDPADLPGTGSEHCARGGVAGSYPSAGGGAAAVVTGEAGAVRQREVLAGVAARVSPSAEAVLGTTPVGARVLLRDGGRGGREDDPGVHRESEVGRRTGRIQDHRAHGALSRLEPGKASGGLQPHPATFSRPTTHRL